MIRLVDVKYEDFVNYKQPSMFVAFPFCSFKCDKENGSQLCQNWDLAKAKHIIIDEVKLVNDYMLDPITHAIVCGGLEPMDSYDELLALLKAFRDKTKEDKFVIYTGYREDEISDDKLNEIISYGNVIIKWGRFRPNQESHLDEVLGVYLVNDEQYAKEY